MVKDKHVIEALGKARVTIEDGKVTKIEEPEIEYCPIFDKYHKIKKISKDDIRKNIEYRIESFGMCTKNRQLKMKDMLSVGISEILRSNVKLGNIDCVVGVCEGTGTLLMTDADLVQGVGGRVSGLVCTTPIPEIIEKIGKEDILDADTARIDQLEGLKMAIDRGYKNIAVTVMPGPLVEAIRNYPVDEDVNVYIFVAHTTNTPEKCVKMLFENADIVTACASKAIIEYAQIKKPYYYGSSVPIYATSSEGRRLLDARLNDINKKASINDYPQDISKMARKLI